MGTHQVIEIVSLVVALLGLGLSATTLYIRYKYRVEIKRAEERRALRALAVESLDCEKRPTVVQHDDAMAGVGHS